MKFLFILYFTSTLLAADNNLYKYNNPLNQSLGRDNDPKLTEDLSTGDMQIKKIKPTLDIMNSFNIFNLNYI